MKFDPNSTKNEGRYRLIDPDDFNKTSFRRWSKWGKSKLPKGISIVVGKHKEKDRLLPQTIRFNKDKYPENKAKEWWKSAGKKLFSKYKTWTNSDWKKWQEKNASLIISLRKIARALTADFPKHPDKKIIRKNEFYPEGLVEEDIWKWYDKNKQKIIPHLKGHEVLIIIKTDDGTIVKRNDKNDKPYRINKVEDFEKLNNGRNVEFHIVSGKTSNIGWVDLDPGKNFDFEDTKDHAKRLKGKLKSLPFVKSVDLKYSGRRGFHLMLDFKKKEDVDKIREELKEFLTDYIEAGNYDKLVLKSPKPSEMRLDISTFHNKGSIRAPYSLNADTGLASLYVLDKEKAKIK